MAVDAGTGARYSVLCEGIRELYASIGMAGIDDECAALRDINRALLTSHCVA